MDEFPVDPPAEAPLPAALPEIALPPPAPPFAWWKRALYYLRFEHLLLVGFVVWAANAFKKDWYTRLDNGLNPDKINAVGLSWVAAPAVVMLAIILLQQIAAGFQSGRARGLRVNAVSTVEKLVITAADWLPFGLFLSIYLMFRSKLVQDYQGHNCDAVLAAWEELIFRGHASLWTEKIASVPLTFTMQVFYSGHIYFTTPATAILCYMKDKRLFRALMLGMTVVAVVGAIGYTRIPGAGPGRFLHDLYRGELPTTRMGKVLEYSLESARAPDDVFPSLHVGISLLCLLAVHRTWRWAFWLIFPWIIGNWLSTVYLRYHYIIDCVAGAALAVAAFYASLALVRGEEWLKRRFAPP